VELDWARLANAWPVLICVTPTCCVPPELDAILLPDAEVLFELPSPPDAPPPCELPLPPLPACASVSPTPPPAEVEPLFEGEGVADPDPELEGEELDPDTEVDELEEPEPAGQGTHVFTATQDVDPPEDPEGVLLEADPPVPVGSDAPPAMGTAVPLPVQEYRGGCD